MAIDLTALLDEAFFAEDAQNASESIGRAAQLFEQKFQQGARIFDVVVPDDADEAWLTEQLLHPLVYFCESEGAPLPRCGGVLVILFAGPRLYGLSADQVLAWGSRIIGATAEQLSTRFGTHESDTARR